MRFCEEMHPVFEAFPFLFPLFHDLVETAKLSEASRAAFILPSFAIELIHRAFYIPNNLAYRFDCIVNLRPSFPCSLSEVSNT